MKTDIQSYVSLFTAKMFDDDLLVNTNVPIDVAREFLASMMVSYHTDSENHSVPEEDIKELISDLKKSIIREEREYIDFLKEHGEYQEQED